MSFSISLFDTLPRDCWVNVNVGQLAENVRRLQKAVDRPFLVAVKGNGYGHGYENAARAFLKGGAKYLGVANLAEAIALRKAGIVASTLILGGMLPHDIKPAAEAGFEFFVWRADQITALREAAKGPQPVRVHIKVDTGMGRLGCFPEEVPEVVRALQSILNVKIAGLATHFASASKPGNEHTAGQIDKFDQAIAALAAIGIRPEIIHAANSSGVLYHPRARYDMARFGIVSYGVPPSSVEGCAIPDGVKTALTWHARVTSTKIMPAHYKISYGSEYEMPKDARVGILPVGYVDGFRRIPKNINTVLIEGQERQILGRVNMDQCMVDLEGFGDITGAEAVLLGRQGGKEISVMELARRWSETNAYDVYSGIATRVPRRAV